MYLIPLPPLRRGEKKRENKGINNCIIISNDSPFFMIPPFISRRSRKHWYNTTMRGYWHGPSLQEALINEQEEGEGGKKGIVYTLLVYIYIYTETLTSNALRTAIYRIYAYMIFSNFSREKCQNVGYTFPFVRIFPQLLTIHYRLTLRRNFSLFFFFFIYIYSSSNAI